MYPIRLTPVFIQLAGRLLVFGVVMIALATLAGRVIRAPIISLTLTESLNAYESRNLLHLMDSRTGMVMKVSDQPLSCCAVWSPDGAWMAFSVFNMFSDSRSVIWDQHDNTLRDLDLPNVTATVVDWSPDGQALLLSIYRRDSNYELYQVEADGSRLTRLTFFHDAYRDADINSADWSPDGRFIVFAGSVSGRWEIYRIDSDGHNLQQLTHFGDTSVSPRFSPDSQQITFVSEQDDNMELFVMDADGNNQRQLTHTEGNEMWPSWSPDGGQLLFQMFVSNEFPRVLEVMNADGTERRRLVDQTSFNDPPSWSPDGRQILYEVQIGSRSELYVIDADGSNVRLLAQADFASNLNSSWQPQP